MANEAKISKEVVRLSQLRARRNGVSLSEELARGLVEETVYNCDPEAELLIDDAAAYSGHDILVSALGVNDIVIKSHRLDVRVIDEFDAVTISRALVATRYMTDGTLVVALDDNEAGKIVGFVSAADWQKAETQSANQRVVSFKPFQTDKFDLSGIIAGLPTTAKAFPHVPAPAALELVKFMSSREEMPIETQRKIVDGLLSNDQSWAGLSDTVSQWSKGQMKQLLSAGAVWTGCLERIADLSSARFKRLSRDEVKSIASKLGEQAGAQPESPMFRKALISSLTRAELTKSVSGVTLKKASEVTDAVLSGRGVTEAVKEIARNPVAVQIAGHIKRNRDKMGEFVDVTTQEILAAFPQMALQPVYGTHSGAQASSLEPINDALKLLYAGELAKQARQFEKDLAGI
jgi:hypothetical protein